MVSKIHLSHLLAETAVHSKKGILLLLVIPMLFFKKKEMGILQSPPSVRHAISY